MHLIDILRLATQFVSALRELAKVGEIRNRQKPDSSHQGTLTYINAGLAIALFVLLALSLVAN